MALAYLCSQTRRWDPWFKVSDNPLSKFLVFIVDHKLRDGSSEEAMAVKKVMMEKMGLKGDILTLDWKSHLGEGVNPNEQTNVESLARRLRYRRLGSACRFTNIVSLFLAHHQDDQYETVLMRLLSGHGIRGLRGMRSATDIPECQGMHSVYQSGFIDDQMNSNPWYNMRPSMDQKRALRRRLREEIDPALLAQEIRHGLAADVDPASAAEDFGRPTKGSKWAPPLEPLDIEDGGITVYRPLLEFSKDRLIATCLENNIPWFEDHTNEDRTLTLRNAVRHLYKHHDLPVALQKPAILRLSERCNARAAAEDAEADRLFTRVVIHDFEPNVGTMLVQLPHMPLPKVPRRCSRFRRQRRLARSRLVASILFQKLLSLVSPEPQLTPLTNLQSLVTRLFPSLAEDGEGSAATGSLEPKAFVVCGVHFVPLVGDHPLRWYLSRSPHPSQIPRPVLEFPKLYFRHRYRASPEKWKFTTWFSWQLFDGRLWIRLRHRLPFRLQVRPFEAEFSKPFREGLADDEARENLAAMLRKYAPGKVRYTLPAIYSKGNIEALLRGASYWYEGSVDDGKPPAGAEKDMEGQGTAPGESNKSLISSRWDIENAKSRELHMLALPTLGVYLDGLENWLQWEVRYRKVDLGFLGKSMTENVREHRRRGWHQKPKKPRSHQWNPSRASQRRNTHVCRRARQK